MGGYGIKRTMAEVGHCCRVLMPFHGDASWYRVIAAQRTQHSTGRQQQRLSYATAAYPSLPLQLTRRMTAPVSCLPTAPGSTRTVRKQQPRRVSSSRSSAFAHSSLIALSSISMSQIATATLILRCVGFPSIYRCSAFALLSVPRNNSTPSSSSSSRRSHRLVAPMRRRPDNHCLLPATVLAAPRFQFIDVAAA